MNEERKTFKIGVIHASSVKDKNTVLFQCTKDAVAELGYEVLNFGVCLDSDEQFSYIETSLCIGLLLNSKAVDFIVTGCSSGQGMMLACNTLPGVLCGYTPTPADAYLFGRINNGNAVSVPLGLNYGWAGEINLRATLQNLFSEPFGIGYPKEDAARKMKDTALLKEMNRISKISFVKMVERLDTGLTAHAFRRDSVADYVQKYGILL